MRILVSTMCLFPLILFGQVRKDSLTMVIPKWTVWIDLINFQDDYPTLLLSLERQFNKDFALHQEFGYVLLPEAYDNQKFDEYLGFKGRTEGRLYSNYQERNRARDFIGIDIAYQLDQYVLDYQRDMGGFFMIQNGKFTRTIIGSHVRIGTQRYFANDKIIISGSVGVGRSFINVKKPPGTAEFNSYGIKNYTALDPFSANIRLKFGFILSKLPK